MEYTKESLQKTWGVVRSGDHADYISDQCKLSGIISSDTWRCEYGYFSISLNELLFWGDEKYANTKGRKQITIPPPPKAKEENGVSDTITKGIKRVDCSEDFELCGVDSINCAANVSASFNDNNEVLGVKVVNHPKREKQEAGEWTPEVGDEVCWSNGKRKGELKSICDGWAWIKDDSGEFVSLMAKYIKKPKSAQELKIEELQTKLCENNPVDNYTLACDIVMGNIEGLSYE